MLILFDIDMTLLKTGPGGLKAITDAGREVFGRDLDFADVPTSGRLDPLILTGLLQKNGVDPTPSNISTIRAAYAKRAGVFFENGTKALPGAPELVRFVKQHEELVTGVLTGNYQETGVLKLQAAGFDPRDFVVQVWGDDSPHDEPRREHLPPVAMSRFTEQTGKKLRPAEVTIIGDTPHDVTCATANGCRVLGVATGYTG
ncbi:MAG: HAD hydrolase-like protein, partial [Planctomycetota bacterium]